jgi:hypothetical protein
MEARPPNVRFTPKADISPRTYEYTLRDQDGSLTRKQVNRWGREQVNRWGRAGIWETVGRPMERDSGLIAKCPRGSIYTPFQIAQSGITSVLEARLIVAAMLPPSGIASINQMISMLFRCLKSSEMR